MTNEPNDARDAEFLDSLDPEVRNDVARDVVSDCRRIILRRVADASRDQNVSLVAALREEQKKYDDEMRLIYKGNADAVQRALTVHAKFLKEYKRQTNSFQPPNLKDGPG